MPTIIYSPSEEGLALIRTFEGYSSTPYRCPAGVLTIGYGHVLKGGEAATPSITREAAETWLKEDAQKAALLLSRHVAVALTQHQADALISFIFNVGGGAFARSTLKKVINRGWHGEVPAQLARWIYAGGQVQRGLVKRREAEAELYMREIC